MGLRTRVESLEKAITVLGLKTSVAVIRSEGLRGALQSPESGTVMQTLWQGMNAIADLALATCKLVRMRQLREDLLYQAVIFHDCGIAVICRRDLTYAKAFQAAGQTLWRWT